MYFNTTQETGNTLKVYKEKALTQNDEILRLFNPNHKLSASQIERITNYPITSIRRALTTLEQSGKIQKLTLKIVGKYGRRESVYSL